LGIADTRTEALFTLLAEITSLDLSLMHETAELRWEPATAFFAVASAWWVKGPLLVGMAGLGDAARRRTLPVAMLITFLAFQLASVANHLLKITFERPRPPVADGSIEAVGKVPESFSFPSGHAMSAFAAATAVAILCPRLRWPALGIAAVVAMSRPYLGMHFWLDVVIGSLLGAAIGALVALVAVRKLPVLRAQRAQPQPA
jgi:undecaprenyl-diphosphatase